MADTKTIADELLALIDAKQKINAAINESAVGTTQTGGLSNKLFSEYGDIIKAIFAIQESVGTQDFSSLNEMYRPGKLTCYRIDTAKASNIGNLPEDMVGVTDRCLNIFSIASESESKYVCQLLITEGRENTFDASTITSMQMFVRLFVPNVFDGT